MNIKVKNLSYEKAVLCLKREERDSWVEASKREFSTEMMEQYDIFEYVGNDYRKVILFIHKPNINGHVISIVPCTGNNQLSNEEHDGIINHLIALFDSKGIEWEELF